MNLFPSSRHAESMQNLGYVSAPAIVISFFSPFWLRKTSFQVQCFTAQNCEGDALKAGTWLMSISGTRFQDKTMMTELRQDASISVAVQSLSCPIT
ncbi:hypothetical protein BaRGS_00000343 [Batillaria attramentaria]|uniref:Uncharacterized protein n=1 Tax=Batillaria attramentaria TaxID=370345 RepID=A0ABD0M9G7_9CAEN